MANEAGPRAAIARRIAAVRVPVPVLIVLAGFALGPALLLPIVWPGLRDFTVHGIPVLVITGDIGVYFRESAWTIGQGSYGTVPSEYPLLANVLFAAVRVTAAAWRPASDPVVGFEITWILFAWWAWLCGLLLLGRWTGRLGVLLWLTPAALYFSLSRFDVYPALATLGALLAARNGRSRQAAAWLGIAIALKGYAIVALPALAVWAYLRAGRREAALVAVIALAPLVASMAIVLVAAGPGLMVYPFTFQAGRQPNQESTWTVLSWVTGGLSLRAIHHLPWVAPLLELGSGIVAAALRPRSVVQLARAFVVAIGGFATFSIFHSPQWVLWYVPAVALSGSLAISLCTLVLGWVSYVYYPITYVAFRGSLAFRAAIGALTAARIAMVGTAIAISLPATWQVWHDRRRGESSLPLA